MTDPSSYGLTPRDRPRDVEIGLQDHFLGVFRVIVTEEQSYIAVDWHRLTVHFGGTFLQPLEETRRSLD